MPTRIVEPRHVLEAKVKAARPTLLSYHGGPLIQNVEVTAIYWGSAWSVDPLRTSLDEFLAFAVGSSLIDQLAEYNVPGFTIGHGRLVQSVLVADQEPPNPVDDTDIQNFLRQMLVDKLPAPNTNSLYFVFTPSGVTVTMQGAASCQNFCGYHSWLPNSAPYVVDPYDDCPGCQFVPGDIVGSTTVPTSHELCEAITDPFGTGWWDDVTGEEIGDKCAGQWKVINTAGTALRVGTNYTVAGTASSDASGDISVTLTLTPTGAPPPPSPPPPTNQSWSVQTEWSNQAAGCV